MIVAAAALLIVIGAGPLGEANGLVRKFMKSLLDEFRTGQPMVNPQGFAAAFGDRSDAGVRLELDSGIPAGAITAKRGRQARSTHRAGTRETVEQSVIGELSKQVGDAFIELLNGADQRAELRRIGLKRLSGSTMAGSLVSGQAPEI